MLVLNKLGILTAAVATTLAVTAAPVRADQGVVELGGFGGWHIVSDRSDIGKPDSQKQVPADSGIFGLRLGYFVFDQVALEVEVMIAPTDASGDSSDDATMFGYRGNLVIELADIESLGGTLALIAGFGGLTTTASDKNGTAGYTGGVDAGSAYMPHVGLSAKVVIGESWGLRFDGRTFFGPASDLDDGASLTPDWEATMGFYKHFGGRKPAPVEEPEPVVEGPKDSDGDGLNDDKDACPDKAEDRDDFEDADGCPDPDNDKDGIGDATDRCVNEAEDVDNFEDDDGCPEADNDKDGLADLADKCPNEPEDKDGFADEDGCPDPDNDGDGVADANDKCPDQQETKNGYQDSDGCFDDVPKAVAKFTGVIQGINFDTGKATIKKNSFRVLDQAVKVLQDYPELRLEIGGHTDDVGGEEVNRKLSQDRAQAVKDYFVAKGISEDRVRAVGYSTDKPLAAGASKKARAKNRRVEFTLIAE